MQQLLTYCPSCVLYGLLIVWSNFFRRSMNCHSSDCCACHLVIEKRKIFLLKQFLLFQRIYKFDMQLKYTKAVFLPEELLLTLSNNFNKREREREREIEREREGEREREREKRQKSKLAQAYFHS